MPRISGGQHHAHPRDAAPVETVGVVEGAQDSEPMLARQRLDLSERGRMHRTPRLGRALAQGHDEDGPGLEPRLKLDPPGPIDLLAA